MECTCIIAVSAGDFQCAKNGFEEEPAKEDREEAVLADRRGANYFFLNTGRSAN